MMNIDEIIKQYIYRYDTFLLPLSKRLEDFIKRCFFDVPRVDRICVRPKSVSSFALKAEKIENGVKKYTDPLNQIQDQIGARIIGFYLDDIAIFSSVIERYFHHIESRTIVPDSEYEFSYFGHHYILLIPDDVIDHTLPTPIPFFELQIKTLFQHAWSEANHDLGYKPIQELSVEYKRKIAFASAQSWGADHIFNELHRQQSNLLAASTTTDRNSI